MQAIGPSGIALDGVDDGAGFHVGPLSEGSWTIAARDCSGAAAIAHVEVGREDPAAIVLTLGAPEPGAAA